MFARRRNLREFRRRFFLQRCRSRAYRALVVGREARLELAQLAIALLALHARLRLGRLGLRLGLLLLRHGALAPAVSACGYNTIPTKQERAEAAAVAGAITPVPGGVGPMTIACLLANTYVAACRSIGVTPEPLDA